MLAYFAILGLTNGDWLARIPALAHGLHLSDGMLGVALLACPAGSFAVASLAGAVVDQVGSRVPTMLAGIAVPLLPISFGLASGQAALMAGMFVFGVAAGVLDVAMNAQAVQLQQAVGRQLMTSFHACYSFGALAGGLIGGAFAWAEVRPVTDFTAVAVPLAVLALLSGRFLLARGEPAPVREGRAGGQPAPVREALAGGEPAPVREALAGGQPTPVREALARVPLGRGAGSATSPGSRQGPARDSAWTAAPPIGMPDPGRSAVAAHGAGRPLAAARDARRSEGATAQGAALGRGRWRVSPLLVLSLLALCSLLGEGAADGWSAVYLRDNLGTSAGFAAMGFAAFALTMAFGRLIGDRLAGRFGSAALLRAGGLLAAAGMATVLLTGSPAGAIVGFAVYGAGLSCTFPQMLAVAGSIRPDRPASAIGRVAGMGYVGLLSGPVMIGGLASAAGLTAALGLPALLALGIVAGAGYGVPRPNSNSRRSTPRRWVRRRTARSR